MLLHVRWRKMTSGYGYFEEKWHWVWEPAWQASKHTCCEAWCSRFVLFPSLTGIQIKEMTELQPVTDAHVPVHCSSWYNQCVFWSVMKDSVSELIQSVCVLVSYRSWEFEHVHPSKCSLCHDLNISLILVLLWNADGCKSYSRFRCT